MKQYKQRGYKVKKRKKNQKSTLLRVLETMCGILFAFALMLLIWDIQLKNSSIQKDSRLNIPSNTPNVIVTNPPDLHIDQNATEERTKDSSEVEKHVAIPGYKTMSFPAGTDIVSVDLYNPEINTGLYYLIFELKVPYKFGNYEVLYKSELVEGGKHLYQINLSHSLSAGIYEHCILHIQPYKVDDLAETNNVDVEFTLKVE